MTDNIPSAEEIYCMYCIRAYNIYYNYYKVQVHCTCIYKYCNHVVPKGVQLTAGSTNWLQLGIDQNRQQTQPCL